jgi:Na+/melibiose symporter-like transporter
LGVITITLVLLKLKEEWIEARGESFYVLDAILYGIALGSIMYGFTKLPDKIGLYMILLGISGFILFIYSSSLKEKPTIDMKLLLNNRVFSLSSISALISYSATSAVSFLLSLYLQRIRGLDPQSAGIVLLFQPLTQAIFSPLAGRLSDRFQPGVIASIGMLFTAVGLFLLRFIGDNIPLSFIVFCSIVLGFGFALFSSPNTNAIMSSVDRRLYGIASSMVSTMRMLGQTFSMGISTIVFNAFTGKPQSQVDHLLLINSTRVILSIFTILCIVGIFTSLGRGKIVRD